MLELENRSQILQAVQDSGPIRRSGISRRTGISLSTVSNITKELLQAGLVEVKGTRQQAMGRPSILLDLNPHVAQFAGGSIIGRGLSVVISSFDGEIIA